MGSKIGPYILIALGLGLGALSYYFYNETATFIARAQRASATVTAVNARKATCSNSGKSKGTHPCTKYDTRGSFVTSNGERIETEIIHGASSQDYQTRQSIPVLYDPNKPQEVKLESTGTLWGGVIASGIFSVFLLGLGGCILYFMKKREEEIAWLKKYGQRVQARFLDSEELVHTSSRRSGRRRKRRSYIPRFQWLNPSTNEMHIFRGTSLRYDPDELLRAKSVEVIIDPQNLKRYWIDSSGFPK